MQVIYKSNKKEEKEKESSSFPLFFCRSPNVDIFMEFLAFDEKLNEVAQVLDDVLTHLLPPHQSCSATTGPCTAPYHT